MRMRREAGAIALLAGLWPHAQAAAQGSAPPSLQVESLQRALRGQAFVVTAVVTPGRNDPVFSLRRYACPAGYRMVVLVNAVCQMPVLYRCSFYQCLDPAGGPPVPATSVLGGVFARANPDCAPDPQQSPCTNSPGDPRSFVPSRQQLVRALPAIFPPQYLKPVLPPPPR